MVLLYALLGMSWNLLGGYTGQISFGHAAFFGTGAYTSTIITGLTLYTQVRGKWALGWLFGWVPGVIDIQHIRLVHFCIMFTFFAFVIHHVYSAVLVSWEERNGLIESIFTGYKFVPKAELEEDPALSKAD
jgi:Ni/Fe-hydrogenase 1 B-type cytochrome subunit